MTREKEKKNLAKGGACDKGDSQSPAWLFGAIFYEFKLSKAYLSLQIKSILQNLTQDCENFK